MTETSNGGSLEKASALLRGTERRYGAGGEEVATSSLHLIDGVPAMPQPNDLSRSLVALDQNSTIIAVIEMSQSSWLVAGMLPGIERQPRKKLEPSPERLLGLLPGRRGICSKPAPAQAGVVRLGHRGTPSVTCSDEVAIPCTSGGRLVGLS